jgi:hypothetical protein
MKALLLAIALVAGLAGCRSDIEHYPINPGGGGSGMAGPDAAVVSADAPTVAVSGRACLLVDPRDLTTCAASGVGGLTVTLGGETATTGDDGSFTIVQPSSTNLRWQITGSGVVPSVMSFGTVTSIPVVATTTYEDMLAGNTAIVIETSGSVMARATRGGSPAIDVAASTAPEPDSLVYYDQAASPVVWDTIATGTRGTIWVPSVPAGTVTLSVDGTNAPGLTVQAGAITIVFVELPAI